VVALLEGAHKKRYRQKQHLQNSTPIIFKSIVKAFPVVFSSFCKHLWLSLSVLVSLHVSCCVCVCTMGLFCVCIHVFVGVFCMIRRLSPKLPWL
uniref:Uncharacterized protein n=1 Tax=Oryzias latipes TaxID=8090 RepID=A0A3P9KTV3_ORYLA